MRAGSVLYLFILILLISTVQIVLFQLNVIGFLVGDNGRPMPATTVVINKEKLNIEGREEPQNNDKEARARAVNKKRIAELRAQKEAKRYAEVYRKGVNKTNTNVQKWLADKETYECHLQSSLPCYSLSLANISGVPSHFMNSCAPSFIIAGTVKSGSTSLYFYLLEHPQVHRALSGQFDKEVRYFVENWDKGNGWYIQQFPPIVPLFPNDTQIHMMSGEASPTYFYDVAAPERIKKTLPNVKLIVILRDPVERAYSDKMQLVANRVQYKPDVYDDIKYQIEVFTSCFSHTQRMKLANSSTDAFFQCYNDKKLAHRIIRSHPYVMDSIYIYQVRNWLRHFPREQILFINGEDMYHNTSVVMETVTKFLGLCDFDWSPYIKQVHNRRERGYPHMSPEVEALLVEFYYNFTLELYRELGIDFHWKSTTQVVVSND